MEQADLLLEDARWTFGRGVIGSQPDVHSPRRCHLVQEGLVSPFLGIPRRICSSPCQCASTCMSSSSSLLYRANVYCDFKALRRHPSPARHQSDNLLTALLRLSKRSARLPSCFYLTDIDQVERSLELETPSTDIFYGVYHGRRVIMKRYRFCTGALSLEARNQVRSRHLPSLSVPLILSQASDQGSNYLGTPPTC